MKTIQSKVHNSKSPTIHRVFLISAALGGGAFFWACGNSSFNSANDDAGSANDASTDGTFTVDSPSGFDDGSTGDDASEEPDAIAIDGGPDAAVRCTITVGAIQNQTDAGVVCPMVGNCPGPTNTTCCIDDVAASGLCGGGCAPPVVTWSCEKTTDCGGPATTKCCLTGDAGPLDLSSCPARIPAASACEPGGCGYDRRMCTKNADCSDLGSSASCRPVYATFGGNFDAGTMVGVCVAP